MELSKKIIPTLRELVTRSNYKHTEVIRYYGNMSLKKALDSESPSVIALTKEIPRKEVIDLISKIFIATSLYFDGELSSSKANLIGEEILINYEYRAFKIEDIIAITKELKEQIVYTKLTPSKILKHISEYNSRRIKMSIQRNQDKSIQMKDGNEITKRIVNSFKSPPSVDKVVFKQRLNTTKYK
ncbi:conserved hypothetical protein [Tenacibaculum maritimum]|uniref:hypothetical protein n=1 Tax=Tenacibaculum maritimum TaxID=107401 RepID=UPI0012E4C0DF|nr:hypothetical protein [Tenacibaculum maritimum]CAA0248069.1 conserved hypothetical protein [Tenacibaculum maritimum]